MLMIIESVTDASIIDHISDGPEKRIHSKDIEHDYSRNRVVKFDKKFINDTITTLIMMCQSKFPELKSVIHFKYPDGYLFDKYYSSNNTESGIGIGDINMNCDLLIANRIKTFLSAAIEYIVDGAKVPATIELRVIPDTTIHVMVLLYDPNAENSVHEKPLL